MNAPEQPKNASATGTANEAGASPAAALEATTLRPVKSGIAFQPDDRGQTGFTHQKYSLLGQMPLEPDADTAAPYYVAERNWVEDQDLQRTERERCVCDGNRKGMRRPT